MCLASAGVSKPPSPHTWLNITEYSMVINPFWEEVGGVSYIQNLEDEGFGAAGRWLGPCLASPKGVQSGLEPPCSGAKSRLAGAGVEPWADVIDVGRTLSQAPLSRLGANPSRQRGRSLWQGRGDQCRPCRPVFRSSCGAASRPPVLRPAPPEFQPPTVMCTFSPSCPVPLMMVFFSTDLF